MTLSPVILLLVSWSPTAPPGGTRPPPAVAHAWRRAPVALAAAPPADALQDVLRAGGLDETQVEAVWSRRPPGKLPGATSQSALLEWLQASLSDEPVRFSYLCLRKAPQLLLRAGPGSMPQLQASMEALRELAEGLTDRQFSFRVAHAPELLLIPAPELRDTAAWLASELGLSSEQLGNMLASTPRLLTARRETVVRNVEWLRGLLSALDRASPENEAGGRLRRVVCAAPLCLLTKLKTLEARASYLRALGAETETETEAEAEAEGELLASLVLCTPTLLHTPLQSLQSKVGWWTDEAGVPPAELPALLRRAPRVLDVAPAASDATVAWLAALGMARDEALAVLRAEPAVLEQKRDQLQLRASFFCDVIGGAPPELAQVPHTLTCNLARHAMLRHAFCLAQGLSVEPTRLMVKGTARFCAEVACCDEEELRAFEAEGKHLQFYAGASL